MRIHEAQAAARDRAAAGTRTGTDALRRAYEAARRMLLDHQGEHGAWTGRLSSSALATATAISALHAFGGERLAAPIESGARWLQAHHNADGGWGDTPDSPSNLPTSLLVDAAFRICGAAVGEECRRGLERYLSAHAGVTPRARVRALSSIYGRDRTFAVPILVSLALAQERGEAARCAHGSLPWGEIPTLPFELACCPHSWLPLLRLQVVSYALPALIAIGQLQHVRHPSRNPLLRLVRRAATAPALRRLAAIQPPSGGFLEAVPLTSFVVTSLAAAGRAGHPVARRGIRFIRRLARPDGSWPIDSNLSTWLTSMSVAALGAGGRRPGPKAEATRQWLLACQHRSPHPYTHAAPGGWGWTDLSGGVPDADDTAGALLALARLGGQDVTRPAQRGVRWLLSLQNADGGWPTFCRGWGKLPFDRSSPDLTAHVLRALAAWAEPDARARRAMARGLDYLRSRQRADGAWTPLWFGNQRSPRMENPVYGTARVLAAYRDLGLVDAPEARRGLGYLTGVQNADGGWGGARGVPSSVEETALAVEALSTWPRAARPCGHGARWLAERVESGGLADPTPLGLYFARLWYSETLYPIVWTVAALGSMAPAGRRG